MNWLAQFWQWLRRLLGLVDNDSAPLKPGTLRVEEKDE